MTQPPPTPTRPPTNGPNGRRSVAKRQSLLSRRDFLALLGLGTIAGAAGGLGIGYLLLSPGQTSQAGLPTPTVDPVLANRLKTVERPAIISRAQWGARPINHEAEEENGTYSLANPEGWREYEDSLRAVYNTLVIHHSSMYEDDDATTVVAIQELHMDDRGWADVGYHFLVGKNGAVYEGRQLAVRGTHTEGHNTGTLGICLLGNFQRVDPTTAQLQTTQALVNWLAVRLQTSHLAAHRDFNDSTVCPGDNLYPLLDGMAQQAQLQRGTEGYVPPPEQLITPTPGADDPTAWQPSGDCPCGCHLA